tara:strand:+ start:4060 stop:4281 length:222 start_codon:yes stop_codon:yes gene_type:complete
MKSKNIQTKINSKSIKEAQDEINTILEKLEKNDVNLEGYADDYKKLIQLNNHIDSLFKKRFRNISKTMKKIKK